DTDGAVAFTIDFVDTAGNPGTLLTSTSDSSSVTFDKTAPTLSSVSIDSDSATNTATNEIATVGDTVTLSFTASETIAAPTVASSVGGVSAEGPVTYANVSGNDWTATFTLAAGDTGGAVAFTIDFADTVGNAGTQVTSTTDSSSVTFDSTAPTLSSVSIDSDSATNTATNEIAKVGD
ncbi:MAG: hypothetical protein QGF21_14820, partial [Vicinamibacterales bacterium]|nr:hypothetical protein [Vicinamibacterales bacterium]